MRATSHSGPRALIAVLGVALAVLPGVAAAKANDAVRCLKKIDGCQKKALLKRFKTGSFDTSCITLLVDHAACRDFDPTTIGYGGCPAIPGTDCDVAKTSTDLASYLRCVACAVPRRLLPGFCGDCGDCGNGVVNPYLGEECDPPGSIGGCPNCQVCKADCTCNTLPAGASCPANAKGGPNLAAVTIVRGADLDIGWTGVGHNQSVVIGAQSFVCLDDCDTTSDPECTGTGPFGAGQVNGPTFGPPLPLDAADVATCVINRFQPPGIQVRKLDLQTGEVELAVNIESQVFATGNLQQPCPTCSGNGLGAKGFCRGFGPNVNPDKPGGGDPCVVEGISELGNTSGSCLPFSADDVGKLAITLDPVTSGEARLVADAGCSGGECPCPTGSIVPSKMNSCLQNSPCLPPSDPASKCPSDDVKSGVNTGIDHACCQTGTTTSGVPIINGCFGEDRPGTGEDFDIVRNGTPAVPQPAWPDPTYPKVARGGKVAGGFCIPSTNAGTINTPNGLGGPGAFILPVDACVGYLGQ